MHIFCRETTAHLELHPHLHVEESSSGNLITPDLWMRNCKSPEGRSPSPVISPKSFEKPVELLPLPLISVAHPSKLIDLAETKRNRLKSNKKSKRRLPATVTFNRYEKSPTCDMPQDLRVRHSPVDSESTCKFSPNIETNLKKDRPDDFSKSSCTEAVPPKNSPLEQSNLEQDTMKNVLEKLLPPPTILYPYPIFLPVPIPIPIPIPIPTKNIELAKETKDGIVQTESVNIEIETKIKERLENNSDVRTVTEEVIGVTRVGRPLRKRKKICEFRPIIKNRRLYNSSK